MKRFTDFPYYNFTVYSVSKTTGIYVKCPECGGKGVVTVDGNACFKCFHCGNVKVKSLTIDYRESVHVHCKRCGKYFRQEVKAYGNCGAAHVTCPECGAMMSGRVERIPLKNGSYSVEIHNASEPFFGLELWYSGEFKGKSVWALNSEHLDYLIEYLGAEIREKCAPMKTQSDHLPKFMKLAKNREDIVRKLVQMREKG